MQHFTLQGSRVLSLSLIRRFIFCESNARWMVALTLLVIPALLFLAFKIESNTQDVYTWLPNGTVERETYDQFVQRFGQDDDIVVSWAGCNLQDTRLDDYADRLRSSCDAHDESCFEQITTGRDIAKQMLETTPGSNLSKISKQLSGTIIGPDNQTTGMIVRLSDHGRENRRSCLAKISATAESVDGLAAEDLRVGGSSYMTVQIDNATNQALSFTLPAAGLVLLITLVCLRSIRLTITTLTVASLSALASVALVCFFGFKINGLLVMMPVLVLVLVLSGAVHMTSNYRSWISQNSHSTTSPSDRSRFNRRAVAEMLTASWRPCSLSIITTSFGIVMLGTSHVQAVQHFGIFSALALCIGLGILLFLFPSMLIVWPLTENELERLQRKRPARVQDIEGRAEQTVRGRPWIATTGVWLTIAVIPFLFVGVKQLQTTLRPEKMFLESSVVNRDMQWLNENLTSLECIEVIAGFSNNSFESSPSPMTDQVTCVRRIQNRLQEVPGVQASFSFANLTGKPPGGRGAFAKLKRRTYEKKLQNRRQLIQDQRLLAEDQSNQFWRIRLGVSIESDAQYDDLVAEVNQIAAQAGTQISSQPEFTVTGIWPLSASGRYQLFSDLATSFILAFLIITPLIMFVLRGVIPGLIAMLPNLFPALLFFGLMGWFKFEVDIGTILTACVGLGIAVDDTLHFLDYYMLQKRRGGDRAEATWATFWHCGRPMLQTTIICAAGLSVFAFSEFVPARQFSIAIVVLLGLALVADLLLLPAMIIGPFGRFFDQKQSKSELRTPSIESQNLEPARSHSRAA